MLSKFSVQRPYTVIVAVIVVLILGGAAYLGMQVDLLPGIDLPYVMISTSYVGASPEEVETVVSKPLEQAMATVSNMKDIVSISSENSSVVMMELNQGTDMDAATNEMRERIDLVESAWDDENIGSPMILQLNPEMLPVVIASVDVEGLSPEEMSAFVEKTVLPKAESVEGVAAVSAMGTAENRINVTIDDGLIDDVNEAIAASINGDINKARRMLNSARGQIRAGYGQLNSAKAEGEARLKEAQSQLDAGKEQLNAAKKEADAAVGALNGQAEALKGEVAALKQQKSEAEAAVADTPEGEEVPAELSEKIAALDGEIAAKEAALKEVEGQLKEAQAGVTEIDGQLAALDGQQAEIDKGKSDMESQLRSARSQLDAGMSQINTESAKLNSAAAKAKKDADVKQYVSKEMISGVLMAQNFSMPAGTLDALEGSFSVKVGRSLQSVEDVGELLLFEMDIDDVDDVRVKDVARIEAAPPPEDLYAKVNGNNGILLAFQKQSDYSTSEVSQNINKMMASLEEKNEGMHYFAFMDQGEYVGLIIDSVLENLLIGAVLAVIVLALFLRDFRPTAIVVVAIPASLLFAMVMMYFTGVTMNLISMSGLALGVGMLVDNSIVVIENIYRLRRLGLNAIAAAVHGAKEISGAIVASTLTTISVFIPIAFTNGMSRELFMDMGLTIGFSLLASLIVALTVVPSLASRVLRKDSGGDSRLIAALKGAYGKAAPQVLKHPVLTMSFVLVLLVAGVALSLSRGFSFMPEYATTELTATLTPEVEDMSDADLYAVADEVMAKALSLDGIEAVGGMSGDGGASGGFISMGNTGQSVSIYLVFDQDHPLKGDELEELLAETATSQRCELTVDAGTSMMSFLGDPGVSLRVRGEDLEALSAFTKTLADDIATLDGIEEVDSDMEHPVKQLMIAVDKDEAMKKGVTVAQVFQAVSGDVAADTAATSVTVAGTGYDIFVRDGEEKRSIDSLADIEVTGEDVKDKDKVKVGDVAEITTEDSPASIYRLNQQRHMDISATVKKGAITSTVTREVQDYIAAYDVPDGISVEVGGESVTVGEYMEDLVKAIALAIVLMYLIMVAQFQSLRSPFIVMFTVPLAFTGGFLALFLCGFDVSVVALLGLLVLSGIVVNNGIVLVDYINRLRDRGLELNDALVEGGKTRLRPILMTALTTILALTTMALGVGEGMEMIQPMAVVAIGGLLYATIMTLFIVPVMYYLMHRKGTSGKAKRRQKQKKERLTDAEFEALLAVTPAALIGADEAVVTDVGDGAEADTGTDDAPTADDDNGADDDPPREDAAAADPRNED